MQKVPPVQQLEFHGVYTAGNPIGRPRGTASLCRDFRVMPGYWLRTRGGRRWRGNVPSAGTVQQLHAFRVVGAGGAPGQFVQVKYSGPVVKWNWMELATYAIIDFAPTNTEPISLSYDSSFSASNPAAACNLNDRPIMYNGLGVRDAVTGSKPPFSSFYNSLFRYFGLDCYCPSGNPSAGFTAGAGYNTVLNSVQIWVGLYHQPTDHYSNGVYAGTINTTGASGTINVSSLQAIKTVYHNAAEQNELYYVFYATIDGGLIPYLILNSTLDGPYKVAVTTSSASLSIASGTNNGWVLNLTAEVPTENYPPRPMRSVTYVGGRLYGALLPGGSGTAVARRKPGVGSTGPDFTYVPADRDLAAVVWSRAATDNVDTDTIGDPMQSWPLANLHHTPTFEQPLHVGPAPTSLDKEQDAERVLVITSTSTFLLQEVADGLHEWISISRTHGIRKPQTVKITRYGVCWMDQHNQIVLLPPNSTTLEILSRNYQALLAGAVPTCADYLYNPLNEIDRYEVFLDNQTSVIHDFGVGGEGYSSSGRDYTAAGTVTDSNGNQHHIVAKTAVYTQEAQPENALVPTTDENADASKTEISGEWRGNWDDFGDCDVRKRIPEVDIMGDGDTSPVLGGRPVTLESYGDFEEVAAANAKTSPITKPGQSNTDATYRAKPSAAERFWHKLVLKMTGHSTDDAGFANHVNPASQGDLAKNFYGSILRMLARVEVTQNRR